ncbi:hypothetical protein TGPRC2_232210 [Toxoplasma gondii TgCatPRC2]|uniref:Uncharacterized protein n=1 Tax=Toxoplasma gondii TgCatPRC2 TaxID=1130821 RepID=A0A151H2T8_TOXGO|nr:hypothetical protein TGPRC2_232210 [Toxoplasma gondii TgCatPRC2]
MQPAALKRGRQGRGGEAGDLAESQVLLQRLGSPHNISALYNQVIASTVQRCTQFQSPKVMDAIERQWRLALQRRTAELRRSAPSPGTETSTSVGKCETAAEPQNKARPPAPVSGAPAASSPAGSTHSGVSANPPGEGRESPVSGGPLESENGNANSEKSTKADLPSDSLDLKREGQEKDAEDDDDFADADVDEAEAVGGPCPGPPLGSTDSQIEASQGASQESSQQEKPPTSADAAGATDTSSHIRPELEEKEEQLDDVSDLDDQEPAATDGIYALYDKVERCGSSGKKTTNWRVVLRHGIIRAGRQEIAFDRFYGELKF